MDPAGGMLSPHDGLLIYTGPTEILGTTFWLMIRVGIIFAIPTASVTTFLTVRRRFAPKDQLKIASVIVGILLCWLSGVSFAYWVLIPAGMGFLLNFGEGYAIPVIRISEYLDIVSSMIFWIGIIFELPLLMFLLSKLNIVGYGGFKKIHKFVYPSAGIFGAFFSPGFDIVTAAMIAVPIIVLYEVGLLLSWLAQPGKGSFMFRWIKRVSIRFLRGLLVALSFPATLSIDLIHWPIQRLVSVWLGDLTAETWVDRSHKWWLAMVERVLWLRK
jgi:sec-independent protein translocase protein TatC